MCHRLVQQPGQLNIKQQCTSWHCSLCVCVCLFMCVCHRLVQQPGQLRFKQHCTSWHCSLSLPLCVCVCVCVCAAGLYNSMGDSDSSYDITTSWHCSLSLFLCVIQACTTAWVIPIPPMTSPLHGIALSLFLCVIQACTTAWIPSASCSSCVASAQTKCCQPSKTLCKPTWAKST